MNVTMKSWISRTGRILAIGAIVGLLASCADGPRDSGGALMSLSEPKDIQPWESKFNTFELLDQDTVFSVTRVVRDNGRGVTEIVTADSFRLRVEHNTDTWFADETIVRYRGLTQYNRSYGTLFWGSTPQAYGGPNSGPVGHHVDDGSCTAAVFATRLKGPTVYRNDEMDPDTLVRVYSCGKARLEMESFAKDLGLSNRKSRETLKDVLARTYGT